ncbi:MAG: site-specific DNA-methyltransferase [Chloroflexi bacterium]|nr:site-specific DNA-methyltransferase [Chloroflexota bacterium]
MVLSSALADVVPDRFLALKDPQRDLPQLAKDELATELISQVVASLPTEQRIQQGDATDRHRWRETVGKVDLVVTSPPYWNLKEYPEREGQLGWTADYEEFLALLQPAWEACYEALVPGGRLIIVVGDVCLSRRQNRGRHTVVPLHASIQEQCREIGFDNLAPIIWHKIANATLEAKGNGAGFMGKPYEPNAVIKNDIEYILMQRKPGGYRSASLEQRVLSVIPKAQHSEWFRQVWDGPPGASSRTHPAPYPEELADRLIRMFSFVGDTVLDPFLGTGTTLAAAARSGRNGIGFDIEPAYVDHARQRLSEIATARVVS